MVFYAFVAVCVIAVLISVVLYNQLVAARNNVRNLWRQIDVQLKRRYDLIPNLVQAVKDVMNFEQETLQKVIAARGRAVSATDPADKMKADNALSQALMGFNAVVERYPELQSNQNVKQLQGDLTGTENAIASVRSAYNNAVRDYANMIETVPTNFIAGFFRFQPEPYFEAAEADRTVPKVALR